MIKDLQKILKNDKIELSREVLLRVVSWLESFGIIGYTTKLIDGKVQQRSMHMRYYFQDMGVASCFSYAAFADDVAKRGYLAENYVYTVIRNKFYKGAGYSLDLLGEEPMFTTLTNPKGELDFILCHIDFHKKIGIEVKSGKNKANTGQRMLDNNMIDQLYLLKGEAGCGQHGNVITLPLYLADVIEFDFGEFHFRGFDPKLLDLIKTDSISAFKE